LGGEVGWEIEEGDEAAGGVGAEGKGGAGVGFEAGEIGVVDVEVEGEGLEGEV